MSRKTEQSRRGAAGERGYAHAALRLLLLLVLVAGVMPALVAQSGPELNKGGVGLRVRPDSLLWRPVSFAAVAKYFPAVDNLRQRAADAQASPEMPRAYSYDKLGFFCKWEVQLEKAARLPVKFRLGEVQYVERMEGKLPGY